MQKKLVNFFGTLGYMSLVFQWLWTVVTVVIPMILLHPGSFQIFVPKVNDSAPSSTSFELPGIVSAIVGGIAVLIGIGLTIYALYKLPKAIAKSGSKATKASAAYVSEHIPRERPLAKKEQKRIAIKISWFIKLGASIFAALLLLLPTVENDTLTPELVRFCGVILALFTSGWFLLQYMCTKLWRIKPGDVW